MCPSDKLRLLRVAGNPGVSTSVCSGPNSAREHPNSIYRLAHGNKSLQDELSFTVSLAINERIKVMRTAYQKILNEIVDEYTNQIKGAAKHASTVAGSTGRKVGGILRSTKGKLHEWITEELVRAALIHRADITPSRIAINKKRIPIQVRPNYKPLDADSKFSELFRTERHRIYFGASVDKQIWVDGDLICGIECKAYTENAMIKRILVDFQLLRIKHPNLVPMVFQLESMLGGDYCECRAPCFGSESTHTLLSHFPDVPLQIVTLLEGERDVDRPLHEYFKPLKFEHLDRAATRFLKAVNLA